jgi:K+-transporting ATPase c subunit
MVEHLRVRWRDEQSMEALLVLRDDLDDMLRRIRSTRRIFNPVVKCPACGHTGRGADPHVSVRATIFALARFGAAAREPTRALQKAWSAYRKTAGLDLFGHAATSEPGRLPRCAHGDER